MRQMAARFLRDESAATAIEYGLLAALIGLVMIVGMGAAFNSIGDKFNTIANTVSSSS